MTGKKTPASQQAARAKGSAHTRFTWLPLVALCASLGGCAANQVHASVRNAQRLQCLRMADETLRQRCLQDARVSHDAYQEQVEIIQPPTTQRAQAAPE
jgi:uncharacterized protein HemX